MNEKNKVNKKFGISGDKNMRNKTLKMVIICVISLVILGGFNTSLSKNIESVRVNEKHFFAPHESRKTDFGLYLKDKNLYDGNVSGFIIQFKETPLLAYESELKKEREDISVSVLRSMLANQKTRILAEQEVAFQNMQQTISHVNVEETIVARFTTVFNGVVLDISGDSAEKIRSLPDIKEVYPNYEVKAFLNVSVPLINADDVWQLQDNNGSFIKGSNVTIAIIDTGIDYYHPDLGGGFGNDSKVVDGCDFVNTDNDPMDDHGHGTHCAGIAAGMGIASNGSFVGVAPGAKLYAYKVLDEYGYGWLSWVMAGVERAVDPNDDGNFSDHVDIISMSLGGSGHPDDPLCQAVDAAVEYGVIVVVAAGNWGPSEETIASPACARNVITIGASTHLSGSQQSGGPDKIAFYSSRGPTSIGTIKPDVLAPGGDYNSSAPDGFRYQYGIISCRANATSMGNPLGIYYTKASGTSMACPHVAGAAALIKQAHPDWSSDEVKMAIRNEAIDLGYDMITQGYGRIDVLKSVQLTNAPPIANLKTSGKRYGTNINVIGTATADCFCNYSLYYQPGRALYFNESTNGSNWIKICDSDIEVINDTLCIWNINNLTDGDYTLKLVVRSQNQQSEDRVLIYIKNTEIVYPIDLRLDCWGEEKWEVFPSWKSIMINGTSTGFGFDYYTLQWRKENNITWNDEGIMLSNNGEVPVEESTLGIWNLSILIESDFYYIKLTTHYNDGRQEIHEIKIGIDTQILKGWPKKIGLIGDGGFYWAMTDQPTIADIDNDDNNDLIFAYDVNITVFKHDGSYVDGWPQEIETWYSPSYRAQVQNGPAVADLDKDGFYEIVIGDNAGYLHIFNHDGSYVDGWPKDIGGYLQSPTIADVNNDSYLDIIVGDWWGYLRVLNLNGSYLEGWPRWLTPSYHPFYHLMVNGAASIADLDKDGYKEIVVTSCAFNHSGGGYSTDKSVRIWILNHDGSNVSGWPKEFYSGAFGMFSSAALADIDKDNEDEIIYPLYNGTIYVWDLDGSIVPGWPQSVYDPYAYSFFPPAVGDINNDGELEILVSGGGIGTLSAYSSEGSLLAGWPIREDWPIIKSALIGYPMLGDLDTDNETEISISCPAGGVLHGDLPDLYTFNSDASMVDHFPKKMDHFSFVFGAPLGDLDNDGDNELISFTWLGNIFIWDLNGSAENIEWPQFYHDPRHTGRYTNDTTPPTTIHELNGIIGENEWYISDTTVTLHAFDNESGVSYTRYKIDNETWHMYTNPFIMDTDGYHTIYYYSVDNEENQERLKSVSFKIDEAPPSIELTKEKIGMFKFKFTANVSDETSGINHVDFYLDGELTLTDYLEPYEWIWIGIGNHQVTAEAFDNAGNSASISVSTPYNSIISNAQKVTKEADNPQTHCSFKLCNDY